MSKLCRTFVADDSGKETPPIKHQVSMETISFDQLENVLNNRKGSTKVTIIYVGIQKVLKTGNPYKDKTILKKTKINVTFNGSYEQAVKNRLEKAGLDSNFKASSLPWGEWKVVNKTISHNGKIYVRFYLHKNSNPFTNFYCDGKKLVGDMLKEMQMFFVKHSESAKQADAGLEEEEQSKPFTIEIRNIRYLAMDGVKYELI